MRHRRTAAAISAISLQIAATLRADVSTTWNGTTGLWTTPSNWSGNTVPANNTPGGSLYEVNITQGYVQATTTYSTTIQQLNFSNATLETGSFTVNKLIMFGSKSPINPNDTPSTRLLSLALNNPVGGTAVLQAAADSYVSFDRNSTFNNFGTFNAVSGTISRGSFGTATFNNSGSIIANPGAGKTTSIALALYGNGSLSVMSGRLDLPASIVFGFTPGSALLASIMPNVAPSATIRYSGATSYPAAAFGFNSPSGNLEIQDADISFSNARNFSAGKVTLSSGTIEIASANASTGSLNFNNGGRILFNGTGKRLDISSDLSGTGSFNINSGAVVFNSASGTMSGKVTLSYSASLINYRNLTVGPGSVYWNSSTGAAFVNAGILNVNAGAGGTFAINPDDQAGATFNDSGSCFVQSGTFSIPRTSTVSNCGPFNVASGATLVFNAASYLPSQPLSGTGTVMFNTGNGIIGPSIGPVELIVNGASINCQGTVGTLSGLQLTQPSYGSSLLGIYGSANFVVNGPVKLNGGTLQDVTLVANKGITFGPKSLEMERGSLTNSLGQLASYDSQTSQSFSFSGTFYNQGEFDCGSIGISYGEICINTGIIDASGSCKLQIRTFNNSGAIYFNSPGGSPIISYFNGGSFYNTGTVSVLAGNLTINPAVYGTSNNLSGSLVIASGAQASVQLYQNQGITAAISGAGDLVLYYGGSIAPTAFNLSGTTTVSGTFSMPAISPFGSTGTLIDYGRLTITANTTSALNVKTVPSLKINSLCYLTMQPVTSIASRTLLSVGSLTLQGTVDVGNNDLLIGGNASLATISSAIASGYANGAWTGTGFTSASAKNDPKHLLTIGVVLNNQSGTSLFTSGKRFDGVVPAASDILIKSTYYGDANLDGLVDGSDYSKIDNGFLTRLTGWFNGDFNYDGSVNGSDYTLIDNAYNTQSAAITSQTADIASQISTNQGSTNVPEPEAAVWTALSLVALGRRHKPHGRLPTSAI